MSERMMRNDRKRRKSGKKRRKSGRRKRKGGRRVKKRKARRTVLCTFCFKEKNKLRCCCSGCLP